MLQFENVCRSYRGKRILDDVSAAFPVGLTLLTGPSGAGKSTLLRLIATADRPDSGRISWNGAPLPAARNVLRRTLGYAPQAVDLPEELTARAFALHMAALKGLDLGAAEKQFAAILDAIGLLGDMNSRIVTFSGGMRRRLVFAQALLGEPRLIALDEPTAELDAETAQTLSRLILDRARDAVVVMTTHLAETLAPRAIASLRVEAGSVLAA